MFFSLLTPNLFRNAVSKCSYLCVRSFHPTQTARLKTLFSEDEQRKITSFINDLDEGKLPAKGKLRPLNKIVSSLPELGPLKDVNDLLERHNLSSEAAVNVCRNILKTSDETLQEVKIKKRVGRPFISRKLNFLRKIVNPKISKFAAVTLAENIISYAVLERHDTNWSSQLVSNWNALDVSTLSLADSIMKISETFPTVEHNVLQTIPTRSGNYITQTRRYGGVMAIICAKHNFSNDISNKIFEMSVRDSANYYKFVVGNEIVSSQPMVNSAIMSNEATTSDDHEFRRSLKEVLFSESVKTRYCMFDYDMRESLCQSLVLGKTFVEIMKGK